LSITSEGTNLPGDLSETQLNWKPTPDQWSIGQCIDHLLVTGRNSLLNIHQAISDARSRNLFNEGPFRYGLIEKWFVNQMGPEARMRFKAPKAYMPTTDWLDAEIVNQILWIARRVLAMS